MAFNLRRIAHKIKGKNVVLHAIYANLPDKHNESINKGWHQHYWKPWKKYLAGRPIVESIKMQEESINSVSRNSIIRHMTG